MRIPLGWLSQHVDLSSIDPALLADRLTIGGIEVEGDDFIGARHPGAVAGRVVHHELDDRPGLAWMQIDVGRTSPILVATRAPNLQQDAVGKVIAVALPGTTVFAPKDGGLLTTLTVAAREMFGRPSGGVGCSALELGTGDDHSGVLLLDDSVAPGTGLAELLDVSHGPERVFTVAILPNIARCQSILGVARETGALTLAATQLSVPEANVPVASSDINPISEDVDLCGRFAVAVIEGVEVKPSPLWMQRRLLACGQQPRNNVVDISNYVMMELGQPTHAYDAATLPTPVLGVRRSRAGEVFKPLVADADTAPDTLPEGSPVITCNDEVVALAGVMGGYETRVTAGTTRVVLESANFDYIAIRRSQAATLHYTEASSRFSRGVDPAKVEQAIRRTVELLRETCPNVRVVQTGLFAGAPLADRPVQVTVSELNAALGTDLSLDTVVTQLQKVGLGVEVDGDTLTVAVPTSRPDITIPSDLFEEVARLHGYDRMPGTMPNEPVPTSLQAPGIRIRQAIEDNLVASGLQQTLGYTLTSPELEAKLRAGHPSAPEPAYTRVTNPISEDRCVVRRSLLPHLLSAMADNLRHADAFHAFELNIVAWPEAGEGGLPRETRRLAIAMSGLDVAPSLHNPKPRSVDAHDLIAVVDALVAHLHLPATHTVARDNVVGFHPGVCAELTCGSRSLGHVGALHPAAATAFGMDGASVFIADLDADAIVELVPDRFLTPTPPRHPGARLDLSVVVENTVAAGDLEATLRVAAGSLLRSATVFDVYEGAPIPAGHKAVGFRFELGADRTLAMNEAEEARDAIVAALSKQHGAVLRT
jgi:phenylalanyl-tRNA synthetase beta chain